MKIAYSPILSDIPSDVDLKDTDNIPYISAAFEPVGSNMAKPPRLRISFEYGYLLPVIFSGADITESFVTVINDFGVKPILIKNPGDVQYSLVNGRFNSITSRVPRAFTTQKLLAMPWKL